MAHLTFALVAINGWNRLAISLRTEPGSYQPLESVCGILRRTYQRNVEMLRALDETFFRSGEYVYERTKAVIEHCHEHMQALVPNES